MIAANRSRRLKARAFDMEQFYLQTFATLLKRWKLLSIVVVIAGAGSVALELFRPPTYEAEIILNISDVIVGARRTFADMGGRGAASYSVSSGFTSKLPIVGVQDAQLSNSIADGPTVVKRILESTSVIAQLHETLMERSAFTGGEVPEIDEFENWLTAEINVIDQTTRPVIYSPILIVRSEGRTEVEARTIVETWVEVGIRVMQKVARLRTEPVAQALRDEEAQLKVALSAVLSEITALESEPNEVELKKELDSVLTSLADRKNAVDTQSDAVVKAEAQALIANLESKRDELQTRTAVYREKRDWLDIREKVARETYIDLSDSLVMAETARRIALSATAEGESAVGLNSLLDHAYTKEKRDFFGKKGRVVAVTFVAAALAAACVVVVDIVLPSLRDLRKRP